MHHPYSNIVKHASTSDADLLTALRELAISEREATVRLIGVLGEVDARRLYLGEGCSSLFTYCTQMLHMAEHAAYARIEAARAARRWPMLLELLADGSLHVTAVTLLSRHLTEGNHQQLFAAARHKSKRDIEEIVAGLRPQPPTSSTVRKLPATKTPPVSADEAPRADAILNVPVNSAPILHNLNQELVSHKHATEVKPIAPERYKLQCTVSRETYIKLREAQDLLRHRIPDGDIGSIVGRALTLLVDQLHRAKHAEVEQPRAGVPKTRHCRHVPSAVKRAVWDRDEGRCGFVGAAGRCTERGFLEYHHVIPFADGGPTTADNLELRCRAHNRYETHLWSGASEGDLLDTEHDP